MYIKTNIIRKGGLFSVLFMTWALLAPGSAISSTQPEECYRQAKSAYQLDRSLAIELCSNNYYSFPISCFRAVIVLSSITPKQAVDLCKNAISVAPAECFRVATNVHGLSGEDAVKLCRASNVVPVYPVVYPASLSFPGR